MKWYNHNWCLCTLLISRIEAVNCSIVIYSLPGKHREAKYVCGTNSFWLHWESAALHRLKATIISVNIVVTSRWGFLNCGIKATTKESHPLWQIYFIGNLNPTCTAFMCDLVVLWFKNQNWQMDNWESVLMRV